VNNGTIGQPARTARPGLYTEGRSQPNILIIGVGNASRGDDGIGIVIAGQLSKILGNHALVLTQTGEGTNLIRTWRQWPIVFLIDAVSSGAAPCTIYRFDTLLARMPHGFFRCFNHVFSVAEAVEMARNLSELPEQLIIYGIEGRNFGPGGELSEGMQEACDEVTRRILEEIEAVCVRHRHRSRLHA
jgi:hydrogenase maturation protease